MNKSKLSSLLCAITLAYLPALSQAELIGGVEFPAGAISFADKVTLFAPVINSNQPGNAYLGAERALGSPDYAGSTNCASQAVCPYVSLGDGGSLTLEFVDNRLTGSGSAAADLWIFEVGPDVEDTFVEISKDGVTYFSVGKVFGSLSSIDIDAYGYGINDQFRFVRLTDDGNEGGQSGITVGADIDAVGAISTVAAPVPEHESWAMLLMGLATLRLLRKRCADDA